MRADPPGVGGPGPAAQEWVSAQKRRKVFVKCPSTARRDPKGLEKKPLMVLFADGCSTGKFHVQQRLNTILLRMTQANSKVARVVSIPLIHSIVDTPLRLSGFSPTESVHQQWSVLIEGCLCALGVITTHKYIGFIR